MLKSPKRKYLLRAALSRASLTFSGPAPRPHAAEAVCLQSATVASASRGILSARRRRLSLLVTEFQGFGTCIWGEPASVTGIMESPFSPGLPHRPDEDWGKWDPRQSRGLEAFWVASSPARGDRCARSLAGERAHARPRSCEGGRNFRRPSWPRREQNAV